jgi:hypothetical protein
LVIPAALVLVAIVLRLGFVAATPDYRPAHDDRRYDRIACAILVSGSYAAEPPEVTRRGCGEPPGGASVAPSAFRPPGYPAFLAGVYGISSHIPVDRWTAARIAQAIMGALLAGLTGLMAARVWGRDVGLVALGLAAVAPPLVLVGASLLSDLLFAVLVASAVLAGLTSRGRMSLLALAGVLVGLAALTRPNALAVLLPLALAAWAGAGGGAGMRMRPVIALVVAALVVITPWTIRNAVAFDTLVPISTHTGESLAGTYNESARERTDHPGAWRPPRQVPALADVFERGDEVWRQRELTRRALSFAREHPGYLVEVSARNSLRLLGLGGSSWSRGNARAMSLPPVAGDVAAHGSVPIVVLALVAACLRATRRAPWWLWLVPLLLVVSTVPVAGEMRMRAAIDPFLIMLAAVTLTYGARRFRRRRTFQMDPDGHREPDASGADVATAAT